MSAGVDLSEFVHFDTLNVSKKDMYSKKAKIKLYVILKAGTSACIHFRLATPFCIILFL